MHVHNDSADSSSHAKDIPILELESRDIHKKRKRQHLVSDPQGVKWKQTKEGQHTVMSQRPKEYFS